MSILDYIKDQRCEHRRKGGPLQYPPTAISLEEGSTPCERMRIHVLGVGSIGTLLAYHLRRQAAAAVVDGGKGGGGGGREVALLLRTKGLPGGSSGRKSSTPPPNPPPTPTLGVEKGGIYHSLQGFTHELIGPAIDTAVSHYARTLTFPPSASAAAKTSAALRALQTPHISTDPIDSLIVALKCHHTLPVLRQLKHRLRPDSCITLVQNGMGVYDQLCTSLWPDPITRPQFILGSTTHGARARLRTPKRAKATKEGGLEFERSVVHTGEGEIVFGVVPDPRREVDYDQRLFALDDSTKSIQQYSLAMPIDSPRLPFPSLSPSSPTPTDRTTQTPLEATLTALLSLHELNPSLLPMPTMYQSLLQKLAVNCAVNPVTGLLGVLNGALVGSPHAGWLTSAIVRECSEVITRYLASLASTGQNAAMTGDTDTQRQQQQLDPETVAAFSPESLERRTLQVLATTARNTSSMAFDMSRLSPSTTPSAISSSEGTEIEYITGYLVRLGERMDVPTPVNRTMLELVKGKEEIHGMSPGMVVRSPEAGVRNRSVNTGKRKAIGEKMDKVTAKL